MKQITGKIDYVLEIDPNGDKHGLSYSNSIESDIVGLMISAQVLTVQLGQWKEHKKGLQGEHKKKVGAIISTIADALRGIKPLMTELLDSYDDFIAHQNQLAQMESEVLTDMNILPKEGE
ncbi:MAG: hypothetical protein WC055_12055 [Melioribacteraceae bacterium]